MSKLGSERLRAAARAVGVHLGISALVASLAAAVVLGCWYPYPYRLMAGGMHLFGILAGVDVVCGPLMTAILFNPRKSRRELTLDLGLVGLLQVAALAYGLHAIAQARPVVLGYEVDRFVAVSAAQVHVAQLPQAPQGLRSLSWRGPQVVGTREPRDAQEQYNSVVASLEGDTPSTQPGWWQPYARSVAQVQQHMQALAALRARSNAEQQARIDQAAAQARQDVAALYYLPLTSRKTLDGWIALLDKNAQIVGYAPVDGF